MTNPDCCVYITVDVPLRGNHLVYLLSNVDESKISKVPPKHPKGKELYIYKPKDVKHFKDWSYDGYIWHGQGGRKPLKFKHTTTVDTYVRENFIVQDTTFQPNRLFQRVVYYTPLYLVVIYIGDHTLAAIIPNTNQQLVADFPILKSFMTSPHHEDTNLSNQDSLVDFESDATPPLMGPSVTLVSSQPSLNDRVSKPESQDRSETLQPNTIQSVPVKTFLLQPKSPPAPQELTTQIAAARLAIATKRVTLIPERSAFLVESSNKLLLQSAVRLFPRETCSTCHWSPANESPVTDRRCWHIMACRLSVGLPIDSRSFPDVAAPCVTILMKNDSHFLAVPPVHLRTHLEVSPDDKPVPRKRGRPRLDN